MPPIDDLTVTVRGTEALAIDAGPPVEQLLISVSPAIEGIRSRVALIARSEASALITGESGSGKEVVARMIHQAGLRAREPFVAVNCAAMPREVIDNELFGHEREAFTGASSKRAGCFELAHRGTLFLDEITEMPPASQAKLLRAIETKSFRRLGGRQEISVDVRIVAATNQDVHIAMKSGDLRDDLYYRLSVIELHVPPLRERKEDIPLLAEHFFRVFSEKYSSPKKTFSKDALEVLQAYPWPGNVRELKNLVERTVLVCPEETVRRSHLPDRFIARRTNEDVLHIPVGTTLEETQRLLVLRTLAMCDGNKSKAASVLGISRKSLYERLRSYGRK
jgi:DNA-binding NtrC family response regulator